MRIGLISDTHGLLETAFRAMEAMGRIDLLIHAGDHYRDAVKISAAVQVPVQAVVGNCDWKDEGPEELLLELEGAVIWITHGHRYSVKMNPQNLIYKALEHKADVAVYGHTHIPGYSYIKSEGSANPGGLLIINPGSVSKPRAGDGQSYGILEVDKGNIKPAIFYL